MGTQALVMEPAEVLNLTMNLPGQDFSRMDYACNLNGQLVLEFAKKAVEAEYLESEYSSDDISPKEVLDKLGIYGKRASALLFGDYKARVVHFDQNDDILSQKEISGLYTILSDGFLDEIQSWTRKEGTILFGNTASAVEESPYPPKALREILANAVAHSLYHKSGGEILVEIYPYRIVVKNNCSINSKNFVNK